MRLDTELKRRQGTLASLLIVTLALLNAGPAAVAGPDCLQQTDDLPCELTIPDSTFLWQYFGSLGNHLLFDDECGMEAPVSRSLAFEGGTWVGFEMPATPHKIRYEMRIKSKEISRRGPAEIVVLDMIREDHGLIVPVLELRLSANTNALELLVYSDQGLVRLSGAAIDPTGTTVAVELVKSLAADTADGEARLLIDGQPALVATCLRLWENLPTGVRSGVVSVDSSEDLGTLIFQPIGFSHTFFAKSP